MSAAQPSAVTVCCLLRRRHASRPRCGVKADHFVADPLRIGTEGKQDASRGTSLLADEAEQEVLGVDMVLSEILRLTQRPLERILRFWRERDRSGRRGLIAPTDHLHDSVTHPICRDAKRLQHVGAGTAVLADQPEQEVLGPYVLMPELVSGLIRLDDRLAGAVCESLEQDRASHATNASDPFISHPPPLAVIARRRLDPL
jgi:hypothetical protein